MDTGEIKSTFEHHYEAHRAAYHRFHLSCLLLLLVLALTETLAPDIVACGVGVWAVIVSA